MTATFFAILNKLGAGHARRIVALFFMSILAGILEVAGIALVFPLIALVNDPSLVSTNPYLIEVHEALGFTDAKHMVYLMAISIGVIFVLKNIYMIFYQYVQLNVIRTWRNAICDKVMAQYLSAPYGYHLKRSGAEMINTLNFTVAYVLSSFILSTVMMVSNLIVAAILLLFITYQFPIPSLVSGIMLLVLSLLQSKVIRHYTTYIGERLVKTRSRNLSVLSLAIGAIKETKAYVKESYLLEIYRKSNREISSQDRTSLFIQSIPPYINEIALVIAVIVMCCMVLTQATSPINGVGGLAVLAAVAFRMAPMVNRALNSYTQARTSSSAATELLNEVSQLSNLESEHLQDDVVAMPFHRSIRLVGVSYSYDGRSQALDNVNLTVNKGDYLGIVGASGSGKTTLVDIILGLLPPQSGQLFVDDVEVCKDNVRSLRKITSYVSQNPYIRDASIRENVAFGLQPEQIDDHRVNKAVSMALLDDLISHREGGTNSRVGDGGKGLSGGQRQRLAIARALYVDPEIMVLDEATSALDVNTEYEISKVVSSLRKDKTVIVIAHRLSTLRECDMVVYMDKGKIIDVGTFTELESRYPDFSRIMELSSIRV